ncbi:hypothetical protein H7J08_00965 [Mycobacterium frederiksbergense]|uniref:hypothetical protein n=1 Tax=Mycolicibacterium frederiksbergense TaxID=117567 RepID=UPI0021F3026F|nr:hypothetical protein [Mycolicibacterium frederiksbergense]MCV7043248.1 hypothetical protein [Mycolicibacterium frederiksbergense]
MSRWDQATARAGWGMLVGFTALSSYLNARAAQLQGGAAIEAVVFHAAVPCVLLVAGLFAELVALSGVHRAAKAVTVTVLVAVFTVTLIASYIAVLAVVVRWNPHAPGWVNAALAAVPDAAMVMAGTVVLSLRVRRHGVAAAPSPTRPPSRWSRLADGLTARVEAALTVPAHRGGESDTGAATSDDVRIASDVSLESAAVHRDVVSRRGDSHSAVHRDAPVRLAVVPRDADPRRIAERLVADGRTTAPIDVVVQVLELLADGVAQRLVAEQTGLSVGAVQRIVKAAREAAA